MRLSWRQLNPYTFSDHTRSFMSPQSAVQNKYSITQGWKAHISNQMIEYASFSTTLITTGSESCPSFQKRGHMVLFAINLSMVTFHKQKIGHSNLSKASPASAAIVLNKSTGTIMPIGTLLYKLSKLKPSERSEQTRGRADALWWSASMLVGLLP